MSASETDNSKGHTYGVVYANDLARKALDGGAKFPPGSVIVREKLSKPDDATPQLLTVMFKRAPGFNPKGGDWEFLTVSGGLTKITKRQKKGSCLDCHARQSARDFVFVEVPALLSPGGGFRLVPAKARP